MKSFILDVLGVEYLIRFGNRSEVQKEGLSDEIQGETGFYDKTITICNEFKGSVEEQKAQIEEVLIHELTHAFLFESGMITYGVEETLPEWFSVMFKKMLKCFNNGMAHLTTDK